MINTSAHPFSAPFSDASISSGPSFGWGVETAITQNSDNSTVVTSNTSGGYVHPSKNTGYPFNLSNESHLFDTGRDLPAGHQPYMAGGAQYPPAFDTGGISRHFNSDPNRSTISPFHTGFNPNLTHGHAPFDTMPNISMAPSPYMAVNAEAKMPLPSHHRTHFDTVSQASVPPRSQTWMSPLDRLIGTNTLLPYNHEENALSKYHHNPTSNNQENTQSGSRRSYISGSGQSKSPRSPTPRIRRSQRDTTYDYRGDKGDQGKAILVPDHRSGKGNIYRHPRPGPTTRTNIASCPSHALTVTKAFPHGDHRRSPSSYAPYQRATASTSGRNASATNYPPSSPTFATDSPPPSLSHSYSSSPPLPEPSFADGGDYFEGNSSDTDPLDCLGSEGPVERPGRETRSRYTDDETAISDADQPPTIIGSSKRPGRDWAPRRIFFENDGGEEEQYFDGQDVEEEVSGGNRENEDRDEDEVPTCLAGKSKGFKRARRQGEESHDRTRLEVEDEKQPRKRLGGKNTKPKVIKEERPWPKALYRQLADIHLSQVLPPGDQTAQARLERMFNMLVMEQARAASTAVDSLTVYADACWRTQDLEGDAYILHISNLMHFTSKTVGISHDYEVRRNNAPIHLLRKLLVNAYPMNRDKWYNEGVKWLVVGGSGGLINIPVILLTNGVEMVKSAQLGDLKMVCLAIRQAQTPLIRETFIPMIQTLLDLYPLESSLFVSEHILDDPCMRCTDWARLDSILQVQLDRRYKAAVRPAPWATAKHSMVATREAARPHLRHRFIPQRMENKPPKWVIVAHTDFVLSEMQRPLSSSVRSEEQSRDLETLRANARRFDIIEEPHELLMDLSTRQDDLAQRVTQDGYISFSTTIASPHTLIIADQFDKPILSVITDMPHSTRATLLASAKKLASAGKSHITRTDTYARMYDGDEQQFPPSDMFVRIGPPNGTRYPGRVPYGIFREAFKPFISWYEARLSDENSPLRLAKLPSLTDLTLVHNCASGPRRGRGFLVISDVPVGLIVRETGLSIHARNGDIVPLHTDKVSVALQHFVGEVALLALDFPHSR